MKSLKYRRAVLKISGEPLGGAEGCLSASGVDSIADRIAGAARSGAQLGVVVGGGNIVRGGRTGLAVSRVIADQMGMLATVINALALADAVHARGIKTRVMSAFPAGNVAEVYSVKKCAEALLQGTVVFLAGGTGNPFFSTDTAAALRAAELNADVVLKATKVDGVYSEDPVKNPRARKFAHLTYREAIDRQLGVMDMTAFSVCMENGIPIIVFNLAGRDNIVRALRGDAVGTFVGDRTAAPRGSRRGA